MMIFSVQWKEGGDRGSFSDLAKQFVATNYPRSFTELHTSVRTDRSQVATGTYEALGGIVHVAQLEALLVLKGLCQGLTQVVRRQGALLTLLELGEKALKKKSTKCLSPAWIREPMSDASAITSRG